jgi:hypothetical protein
MTYLKNVFIYLFILKFFLFYTCMLFFSFNFFSFNFSLDFMKPAHINIGLKSIAEIKNYK